MTEEFLQYLWKFRLMNRDLRMRTGEPLIVFDPGEHNMDGGPDFINARVRLGDTTWAGNIEIHVNEEDWFRHNHHHDMAYKNVILHVVYEENTDVISRFDRLLPTMIMKGQYPDHIYHRYGEFLRSRSWIPCEKLVKEQNTFHFDHWSASLIIERLEERSSQWKQLLEANKFDWAETLHQVLGWSFGLKINSLPFELLAKSLPLKLCLKYKNDPFKLEALAFGQAGMLNAEFMEEYPNLLKKEYGFLAGKHSLKPMDPSLWKFLRLRPPAFPTIRIAQWASILQHADRFFSSVLEHEDPREIWQLFSGTASVYWDDHFVFEKPSAFAKKTIGSSTIRLQILNAMAPFIYLYGDCKGMNRYKEKAVTLIEQTPAEKNSVVGKMRKLGFPADNALKTQALIHLKSKYCDKKKCLDCRIGAQLLSDG